MTSSLFRTEALEYRKDKLYGEVILLQPLSLTLLVGAVLAICLLILTILFWGTYARKEAGVKGYLVPDKGIVKMYASQQGTVSEVHIQEGEIVNENQNLVTLFSEHALQGGRGMESVVLHELDVSRKQYLQRMEGEKALERSEGNRLKSRIASLALELEQIEANLLTQSERVHIQEARVAGARTLLLQKNLSEIDYQKLKEDLIVQKQQYQELLRAKNAQQNAHAQALSDLEQLPIKIAHQLAEIEHALSELSQRRAEVEGRRIFEMRAPLSGTVTAVQAKAGQWIGSNTPLLAIIPKDAFFQAELFVPSRAIGFISEGQTVRLRYDAFPYRRFGIYEGKVSTISKHVLLPSELPVPLEIKEPVYRITVDLKEQHVQAYGKQFALQAGISFEADIILEKQTLFEWIMDPIISLRGKF